MSSPIALLAVVAALVVGYLISAILQRHKAAAAAANAKLEATVQFGPQITGLEANLAASKSQLETATREHQEALHENRKLADELSTAKLANATLQADLRSEREASKKRIEDEGLLANRFDSLARQALSQNSTSFFEVAKKAFEVEQTAASGDLQSKHSAFIGTLQPIEENIAKLTQRVERLSEDKDRLANEANNLANAFKKSEVRGRWGELELQKIAELAGMTNRCDFTLQQTFTSEDDARRRPDMVVSLPLGRYVVVDSKAVMDAYVQACQSTDPKVQAELIAQHVKHIRSKIDELAKIDYATVLAKDGKNVADMVVCFIPGEPFFSAAVSHDPLLLEYAAKSRVFLASPTILIVLLRAIALGWRDHQLSESAEEIRKLGRDLYSRLGTMKDHFDNLGEQIEKTVTNYNAMVSSLNRRVFPQARKFQGLGAVDDGMKLITESSNVEHAVSDHASADWQNVLALAAGEDESNGSED